MIFDDQKILRNIGNKQKLSYTTFQNINTDTDENILPIKYATNVYNFSLKNGALTTGKGFSDVVLPTSPEGTDFRTLQVPNNEEIVNMWQFRFYDPREQKKSHKIIFSCKSTNVYEIDVFSENNTPTRIYDFALSENAVAVNYRINNLDHIIFLNNGEFWVYEYFSDPFQFDNVPSLKTMCSHFERIFATGNGEENTLWFSDDLNPTNWRVDISEAGYIQMLDERGALKRVISFLDYLYVVREYGFARVSAFGDQSQFSVSQLFTTSSKIYENTVCVCGNKMLMLARDGMYIFDGYTTGKMPLNIQKLFDGINNEHATAVYHEGKYYLACRLNFDDEIIGSESEANYKNNALIEIDVKTNLINITRGVDICRMLSLQDESVSKLMVSFNGHNSNKIAQIGDDGKFFNIPMTKKWESPFTDFGHANRRKVIHQIYFSTENDCTVSVISEREKREFKVIGKKGVSYININMKGEKFAINFATDVAQAYISHPEIILSLV